MSERPQIRLATPSDADDLAALWIEFGRYYAERDAAWYRVPEEEGLSDWFRDALARDREDDDVIWLVADEGGRVVGSIQARIWRPFPDAERQLVREVGEVVLKVDSLVVTQLERRRGVGRELMSAIEDWAVKRGASQAVVISVADSPTSVPFYESGMGYRRKTIGFWKELPNDS
ncbi:MAG TPA: GNAT family N-acetyltransferase [Actinomycetota bacterium]|nr:GNAT family N-acetyltransferase [Actinomycetota bacterium]